MGQLPHPLPAYSTKGVFYFTLQCWLFIFITFFLPLDLLYRTVSLLEGMPWWQLILSTASLVLFFSLLALGIAAISLLLSGILQPLTQAAGKWIAGLNAFFGVWVLVTILFGYCWKWILKVFNLSWTLGLNPKVALIISLLTLVIVAAGLLFNRSAFLAKIHSLAAASFKFNAIIILIAGLIGSVNITYTLVDRYQQSKVGSQVTKANPRYPNIILITFDALAAQNTSVYGHSRDTTPNLKKLARECYVFDRMFASSNFTPPSLASLLTGKHPLHHGILNDYSYYTRQGRDENLPFLLRKLGYDTMAVCAVQFGVPWNRNMEGFRRVSRAFTTSPSFGVLSQYFFAAGLGSAAWLAPLYRENPLSLAAKGLRQIRFSRSSGDPENDLGVYAPEYTLAEAAAFMQAAKNPFFLWVHLLPPHDPYMPRKEFLYTFLKEKIFVGPDTLTAEITPDGRYPLKDQPLIDKLSLRYDEHILYADHEVGKFLDTLRQNGLLDRSLLLISADHGEMFARGFLSHCGPYLYQPLINVPLLLRLPGQTQGRRLAAPVSHVDLPPTILDFLGVAAPSWMDGRSVKGALDNPDLDTGTKFAMNLSHWGAPDDFRTKSIAAVKGNYKLIYYLEFRRYELYDLTNDPHEDHNLLEEKREIFLSLKDELERLLAR